MDLRFKSQIKDEAMWGRITVKGCPAQSAPADSDAEAAEVVIAIGIQSTCVVFIS